MGNSFTLLIDCKDEMGLIFKITSVLFKYKFNIIRNDEYVSPENNHFFMRSQFSGSSETVTLIEDLKSLLPPGANIRLASSEKKKLVILVTREYHCLSEILTRVYFNELHATIDAVISNYKSLQSYTENYDVPFYHVPHNELRREAHEEIIDKVIAKYSPDYVVLAKYMRILSRGFVSQYQNRIINIHHSFLPAFMGANPYKQACLRGVKIIGATAHFVNDRLDDGPIIVQSIIPVDHRLDATQMSLAGKDIEKLVLSNALKIVLDDKVFVNGNKTIVFA
jgi:formyltetrahydrofolate deformylase